MTDNEKLIEEALVAYWGGAMNAHVHGSAAGMRAAFAVFEKALGEATDTPTAHEVTSDDREALFEVLGPILHLPISEIRDRIVASDVWRFRRSEKVHTPTDDEREALIDGLLATKLISGYDWLGTGSSYPTDDEIRHEVGEVADAVLRFRRSEVPEPSEDRSHEFANMAAIMGIPEPSTEDWDNRDDEVNGETRGFLSCGRCAWSMSRGLFADLHEHERTHDPEPQGEPSDAQVDPWIPHARRALHIHDTWGTPDDPDGKTRPMSDYTELSARMANTLRAALAATEEGGNTDV
ncbi:hypothetical protein LJR042_003530 [Microbacterium maritypicum]|uniref:hypothetical protein n=1 Tax=Microbacterium maritypicum TaxID=33918 RepID=UPI003ECF51C9